MNSIKVFNQRVGYMIAAGAILLSAIVPALVSAATVTARSIELSSSSATATGVTYKVDFTTVEAAGAFVIDFCSDSPAVGQVCTAPTGFSVSSATTATSGFTRTVEDSNTLRVAGTMAATTPISVELDNITNPDDAGPLYARITTYVDDSTASTQYVDAETPGAYDDEGGFAISITDTVGVSGAVLESMTFCVADIAITEDCGNAADPQNAPVIKLGEPVPGTNVVALDAGHLSTGSIYTQISTNAVNGAIIRLKSGAACGGLKRIGVSTCDIAPALTSGITAGQAKFGVKTATATDTAGVTDATGTLQPVTASGYNNTTYALNYLANNSTGVTSPYGDPFLDTDDAPVNNKNMQLTFGASVSNDTPAGLYSADISMIATGKF